MLNFGIGGLIKILGIDPGSLHLGYGIIEIEDGKPRYLSSGCLKFCQKTEFLKRTLEIAKKVDQLIGETDAGELSLEALIFTKNPNSLIKLSQVRGMLIQSARLLREVKISEYSPNLIKQTAVGHGHASKKQMIDFMSFMFPKAKIKSHDEADALAIAYTHSVHRQSKLHKIKKTRKARTIAESIGVK